MVAHNLESLRHTEDMFERVKHHMRNSQVPNEFIIEFEVGKSAFLEHVKVLVAPLAPKHLFGNKDLPRDPRAVKVLEQEQKKWGTGKDSVPMMLFTPRGTMEYTIRWAMARPDDFTNTPEQLLGAIAAAKENKAVGYDTALYIKSLEFVYAATTGTWTPGDTTPAPLATLPKLGNA